MRKFLFLTLFSCLVAFGTMAQEIVIADYEVNSIYPDRTGGWNLNNIKEGIDNPSVDDINSSDKVASFKKGSQWSDAVQLFNFHEAISLGMYPLVKMKVLSETTVSKKVSISLTDINGFSQSIDVTLPDNSNTTWTDLVFDFSEKALNTPISLITSATMFFDYGSDTDIDSYYYFDDIRFSGPKLELDPATQFTLFKEEFGGNRWEGCGDKYLSIGQHYDNYSWGRGFTQDRKFYIEEDSAMVSWPYGDDIGAVLVLEPSSVNSDFSYLVIRDIPISGFSNYSLSFNLHWKTAPSNFEQAPIVEYNTNEGTSWFEAFTTTDSLPTDELSWGIGVTYPLDATGSAIQIRITNDNDAICYIDNIKLTGTASYVTSVDISVADGITAIEVDGGTKQINATILPAAAPQNLYWTVIESDSTGRANISDAGLLTAEKNGTVSVIGRSRDLWGIFADTLEFVLTNQIFPVTTINITGPDSIFTDPGKGLYTFEVLPVDADTLTYTVSLVDSLGEPSTNAYLTADGTLTALKNGYVIIQAVADDYMGAIGKKTVKLQNQEFISVASIEVIGETTISVNGGTLQVSATVLPVNADARDVEWSIANETGSATISETGLIQAITNGTVTVTASAFDGSGVSDALQITISNQTGIASKEVQKLQLYPNPVQNELHINNFDNTATVEIFNSLGKVVMTARLAQNQNLDVQNLNSGMYIIRAISDDVVYQATFIKK